MKSFFDPAARTELLARYDRLAPDARARWGKMDAPRMLCHVTDALRMTTGELTPRPIRTVLLLAPVRWLVMRLPFPRGAPTAPELLSRPPADWDADLALFRDTANTLASRPESEALPAHPLFGRMTRPVWGQLLWKHLDHHARQFGL